jgi:hypothetical protein
MSTTDRNVTVGTCLAVLVAALLLAWPAGADACECPSQTAFLGWPKANAIDVPVDGTLIVLTSDAPELRTALHDATGLEVSLAIVRVLDASPGCGNGLQDVVFLRPTSPLQPSTEYRLTLGFAAPTAGASSTTPPLETTFVTGAGTRAGTPPPTIERWLFAQLLDDGSRILQVFASATGAEPAFMVTKGMPSTVIAALGPLALESPMGVSLGKVDCANLEFVDATGQTLKAEQLCTPERCERPAVLIGDTCGLNMGGESWESWQAHDGGCGAAVTSASGCSLAPGEESPSSLLVFAVLSLTRRCRRRLWRRTDLPQIAQGDASWVRP